MKIPSSHVTLEQKKQSFLPLRNCRTIYIACNILDGLYCSGVLYHLRVRELPAMFCTVLSHCEELICNRVSFVLHTRWVEAQNCTNVWYVSLYLYLTLPELTVEVFSCTNLSKIEENCILTLRSTQSLHTSYFSFSKQIFGYINSRRRRCLCKETKFEGQSRVDEACAGAGRTCAGRCGLC